VDLDSKKRVNAFLSEVCKKKMYKSKVSGRQKLQILLTPDKLCTS
jgi:hypothetical protein